MRRKDINDALDDLLREHEEWAKRLGRVEAVVVFVAAARILLADFALRERMRVERRVDELLP